MVEKILDTYDLKEFLDDAVYFSKGKIYKVKPIEGSQRRLLWDRLIRELEKERDEI